MTFGYDFAVFAHGSCFFKLDSHKDIKLVLDIQGIWAVKVHTKQVNEHFKKVHYMYIVFGKEILFREESKYVDRINWINKLY